MNVMARELGGGMHDKALRTSVQETISWHELFFVCIKV